MYSVNCAVGWSHTAVPNLQHSPEAKTLVAYDWQYHGLYAFDRSCGSLLDMPLIVETS
jgi:hypothetical protein